MTTPNKAEMDLSYPPPPPSPTSRHRQMVMERKSKLALSTNNTKRDRVDSGCSVGSSGCASGSAGCAADPIDECEWWEQAVATWAQRAHGVIEQERK